MAETPSTELQAVNTILRNMGEAPVVTLDGDLPLDASKARDTLREVSESVQIRGWFWNTETAIYAVDGSNNINLPANTLAVKSAGANKGTRVTMRDGKLYRIMAKDNGFTFDGDMILAVTFFLDFEELPPVARRYISMKAARTYQARELGDELTLREDTHDEQVEWATLRAEENENSRRSLREALSVAAITDRRVVHNIR